MDPWDMDDEGAHTGHDVYLEDDEGAAVDVEDLIPDDPDATAEDEESGMQFEGLDEQRQSVLDMLSNAFISIVPSSQGVVDTNSPDGGQTTLQMPRLTIEQLRMLLEAAQARGLRAVPVSQPEEDEDDEDDDDEFVPDDELEEDEGQELFSRSGFPWIRRPAPTRNWFKPVTEPQQAGIQVLNSGDFGRLRAKKQQNIRRLLKQREMGMGHKGRGFHKEDFSRRLVPNTNGTIVATYSSNAYSGQYSADSSFYYTCTQDWDLYVYDTNAPFGSIVRNPGPRSSHRRNTGHGSTHETTMKAISNIDAIPGAWTITDSHLSPDNERLIYSSISSTVYMTKIFEPESQHIPLRFSGRNRGLRSGFNDDEDDIGIYSCRFSADGNEVIAGGNGRAGEIRVFDLLANKRTITINAHNDDVNSCCWADSASGNVLISASDDTFLKVWDRRSLGSTQKPSGVLVGHTEGITYVSAKGDGRYVVSNGKDQAMRLWDLRKMRSHSEFEIFEHDHYGHRGYDYRYGSYPKPRRSAHPKDCSVMTYRGHQVFRTLIRCHFSPMETTGANYLYTGSYDGKIHIYSLDGRIVQVLNRPGALPMSQDPSESEPERHAVGSPVCVRDVSWHSQEPVLMSVGWAGDHGKSSVARHEWKGIGKLGDQMGRLEDYVERQKFEREERARRRSARQAQSSRSMPGGFDYDDDEEEEQ